MRTHKKGSDFERAVAKVLTDCLGTDVQRVLLSGVRGEGDIQGIPAVHIECKRREQTRINEWYEHERGKANGKPMAIIHKKSREPIFVTMTLDDWMSLFREAIR